MYCRHTLKDLHAALCEHGCLYLTLETQTYCVSLKNYLLYFQLFMFQNHFTLGNEKKMKEHEKSTSSAVFVGCLNSLAPNQKLNLDAALTLYLLCTIACKLCHYFQVPYHPFWAISVSTERSCILILNFGAKGQSASASARERIRRELRLNGIPFVQKANTQLYKNCLLIPFL